MKITIVVLIVMFLPLAFAQAQGFDWSYQWQSPPVLQPVPVQPPQQKRSHRRHRSMEAWKQSIIRDARRYCAASHDPTCPGRR